MLAGLALVLVTGGDAVSTLVTTRRRHGQRWPTRCTTAGAGGPGGPSNRRGSPERRESFLGIYGPLSLLGLLVFWVTLLVAGWGAVWWGLRSAVSGVHSYLDAVYFAGVGFFTVGFGDLLPTGGLARLLVIVEAFMGLLTMALLIGYCRPCTAPTRGGSSSSWPWTTSWTSRRRRSGSSRPPTPMVVFRGWRRPSPTGSGGATTCSTPAPPSQCWPCTAPASRGSTG